ncbi:hypothetical protein [Bacillus sp. D386]|uniref:hypothetical protein n=1 Tax=Bacillus sp. D386 TaxID=2587155 RepID=UPI001122CC32|nr:hypothetical protein [Bacillus sp. D386]
MTFKTSVNIRFDIGKEEFVNRYIPTPSHTEALIGLLDGFLGTGNRSHIIVGAYGTGKSLLATVVSTLMSKQTNSVEKLTNKFKHFNDEIADKIQQANNTEVKYIPIALSGNEGRFRKSIIQGIVQSIHNEGIEVVLPGVSSRIIQSINVWKDNFPLTYEQFEKSAINSGYKIEDLYKKIVEEDEATIQWFCEIYPKLTSGAEFEVDYGDGFLQKLEYLLTVANKNNLGFIVIYDEFGRFLQGLPNELMNETMQDIQDLAEIADREKALHVLLITHKNLRQYFTGFNDEIAREFQRVEKRLRQYTISSDQATFLKIAEVILSENLEKKPNINTKLIPQMTKGIQTFSLFPILNVEDRQRVVIESLYPVHPVTVYLLPKLSSVFGQNERTLFTFLESKETGGLQNHISKSSDYYSPYKLFDYFFTTIDDGDISSVATEQFILYRKALSRIDSTQIDISLAEAILKFISLWQVCNLTVHQKLTTEFIQFALLIEEDELSYALKYLSEVKAIRFNPLITAWEIHTGSIVDLQKKIADKKNTFVLNQELVRKELLANSKAKYFFPNYYNDEIEMTRFAKVTLILNSEMHKLNQYRKINNHHDINIYYIIPDNTGPKKILEYIRNMQCFKKEIFVIHPDSVKTIKTELINATILEMFMLDKNLLAEDKGILEEIKILQREATFGISKYINKLQRLDKDLLWHHVNKTINPKTDKEMSEWLSELCFNLYPLTPKIVNDLFNRMKLSSQQKAGAKQLINGILEQPKEPQFGISGTGPAYAIYAAIFKNNGHFETNIHTTDYENINYEPYAKLRNDILEQLERKPIGNFADLIKIFTTSPYGIRQPVVPLLLVALLRDRWSEFMLYRNDIFVPGLNGDKLYEILEEEGAENYRYSYEKIANEHLKFYNQINEIFAEFNENRLEGQNVSRLIQTCGTLVKWLRSLPRYVQISHDVSDEFDKLRRLIKQTEVKPQQSLNELFEIFGCGIESLRAVKQYAEQLIYSKRSIVIETFGDITSINSREGLFEWLKQYEDYKKTNDLVKSLNYAQSSPKWIDEFIELFTGVRLEDWSDKTFEKFVGELTESFKELTIDSSKNGLESKSNSVVLMIGEDKKVITKTEFSVKAKTVYSNIDRILKNAGRSIPNNEIEYMIYLLTKDYIE